MTRVPAAGFTGGRFAGRLVAVSVSDVENLAQMGFPEDQMDRVLQSLLVPLVSEKAGIGYGGRIEHPHNFTLLISDILGDTYRRLEQKPGHRPFVHFVAQHRFARTKPGVLVEHLHKLAPYGEIWVTGESGVLAALAAIDKVSADIAIRVAPAQGDDERQEFVRGPRELSESPCYRHIADTAPPDAATSFTHMRRQMAMLCDARVQVGGRTTGFTGAMSGLCEEALATIVAGRPLVVLGGFGGASRDIAAALEMLDGNETIPLRDKPVDRSRYEYGLAQLQDARPAFEALWEASILTQVQQLARSESVDDIAESLVHVLSRRLPVAPPARP